jgi:hypothetical protein
MKKFTLFLFFVVGLASLQAQDLMSNDSINDVNRTLILKFGVNLVDSNGDSNPFSALSDFDQMAFSNNYTIELEYRFSKWFSLAMILSKNKWKANEGNIDGIIINTDRKYLAIDIDLKYYYDEAFGGWFENNNWLELYLHGGVGTAYQGSHADITLNFGPGANFWISEQFGINLNGTAKWALNHGDQEYDKILAPKYFFRIHKKYLINIKYIININNADGSNCELVGNHTLPAAKRRKEDLVSFLNIR